jgi:mono/diheme cytochrome c family protein
MKGRLAVAALAMMLLAVGSTVHSTAPRRSASTSKAALVAQGLAAFEQHCAACHGKGPSEGRVPLLPGTFALSLKYRNGELPAALEERSDLTPEFIVAIVRNGIFSMPPLRKTEVSDQELRAIAAYLREASKRPGGPIRTGPNKVLSRTAN